MNSQNPLQDRLDANWRAIVVELEAPPLSRTERLVRRLGVPHRVARLGAATPALRRSWWTALVIALLFGLAATGDSPTDDTDRLLVFLTVAPLVPLLGVALAYGPGVDPSHEQAAVTPRHGLRLLLIRAVTVLGFSAAATILAGLLTRGQLLAVGAWILPAVALALVTLVLGERLALTASAAIVAVAWLLIVIVTALVSTDDVVAFRAVGQVVALVVAGAAATVLAVRRREYAVARQLS